MKASRSPRARSWLALLAATTLGVEGVRTLHAEVRADADWSEGADYRLVVQSYDAEGRVDSSARPVGSYQRAVTASELRRGVHVSLVELRSGIAEERAGSVFAWIEPGKPDLEFDARAARPSRGAMIGLASRGSDDAAVRIRLSKKAA